MKHIIHHKYAYLSYAIVSIITALLLMFQNVDTLTLIRALEYWVVVFTFTFAIGLLLYLTSNRARRISNVIESLITIVLSIAFLFVVNGLSLDNNIIDIALIYLYITIAHIVGVRMANALTV